jgi:hypothetical protein
MSEHVNAVAEPQKAVVPTAVKQTHSLLQRACGGSCSGKCEECEKEEQLQRKVRGDEQNSAAIRSVNDLRGKHDFSQISLSSVQTKLTISHPGDQFEREADRVAEEVMRMPQGGDLEVTGSIGSLPRISRWTGQNDNSEIRRQTAEEEEEEEFTTENLLSLKEASGSSHTASPEVAAQIQSARGSGEPLGTELRAFFEPRFGHDFSSVRIHRDARASETTRALNARAYTLGRDIAFAPNEFQPETHAGRMLLAHELTHVVQQSNQVQTVMRACDCPAMGATKPAGAVDTFLRSKFPYLRTDDYCITGPANTTYNCFAWSMGDTSKWLESEVDSLYGNKNGTLELSDFDDMYANQGLKPVTDATPANPEIVLYAKGTTPTHAARNTGAACGGFESKLGSSVRIAHYPDQLEGGTVYGDINRYYVPR